MTETDKDGATGTAVIETTDRADAFEMIEDAATLAYAVYRGVDFDAIQATGRDFDDEFVGYLEDAASIRETLTEFHQELADACEVRAVDAMGGDVRRIVRKYDAQDGRVASRRFLRTVRRNPAHVRLEMKHQYSSDENGDGT